mgnify:CR=1 FL=1
MKHENRRVLFVVIILLCTLLLFFYYNNNNKYYAYNKKEGITGVVKDYMSAVKENYWKLIPLFLLSIILYYSFGKYNDIKIKQENKVDKLEVH